MSLAWYYFAPRDVTSAASTAYKDSVVTLLGADLEAYWPADESSGNLGDYGPNSWTATASGASTYQASGPTINGTAQSAVQFSGTSYFTVSGSLTGASAANGRTYAAWVYLPGPTSATGRYITREATNQNEMHLRHDSAGSTLVNAYQSDGATLIAQASGTDLDGDGWTWIAGWWDPADQDVYCQENTSAPTSGAGATNIKTNSTGGIGIGATVAGGNILQSGARMCHMMIVNRVLTSGERTKLATGVF